MPRTLVVAAVQTAAHNRTDLESAWAHVEPALREAAARGAGLAVLPEGTLPAYVLGYEPYDGAEIAQALERCRALAAELRMVIVAGVARRENGRTFNSALVIDADGSVAGAADKHFLWHFDRQWFAPGERLEPVRTSIGTIGALICADGRIPTIARALVDRGAELLVMPTAWVTSGRDPENLENVQADLLARVRARENGVPFVVANKCGVELGCVAYCGKSQIVSADGTLAAIAPQHADAVIAAEIDVSDVRAPRISLAQIATETAPRASDPIRVALCAHQADAPWVRDRLRILEAQLLIAPGPQVVPAGDFTPLLLQDDRLLDPGFLAAHRLAGWTFAVWQTQFDPQWQVTFARARALELKMYLAVIDTARRRAFAVDPDGAVICGTFDGYEIASFTYDPLRTEQTLVAPGTDVRAGLERAYRDASA